MAFEQPETFGKFVIKEHCITCKGSGKRPAQGGLKGGNFCRRCNGNGFVTTEYNIHAHDGGFTCSICGLGATHGVHELKQKRLL